VATYPRGRAAHTDVPSVGMGAPPADAQPASARAPLVVRSRPVDLVGTLVARLPRADGAMAWVRDGTGLVGWGEAARFEMRGRDRFREARDWWREWVGHADVEDHVGARGSGPVAFGSFAFRDDDVSVLVVPEVVLGRCGGQTWLTTIGDPPRLASPDPVRPIRNVRYAQGQVAVTAFRSAVAAAIDRIGAGDLDKVVLAHDLIAVADEPIDVRAVLGSLSSANPDCWTFAVDGFVGATPELLVSKTGDRVVSRVLAGTTGRGGDADDDRRRVAALLSSAKDRAEHRYAVESLVATLGPHVRDFDVPTEPYALQLSNVAHLATDVAAIVTDGSDVLDLVEAVHPTAAVGGTPTQTALDAIAELEPMDRGRYAAPVGWVDARGDGDWAIALRCAQLHGATARLFAGGGIVAGSDPDAEVAEAAAKFIPMREALEA
jgi:menaquinone-specific isochorismate synthase